MRILTVRQPWAWAIIHGQKDVENRVRNIAGNYRGPVAIHVGLRDEEAAFDPEHPMHALIFRPCPWQDAPTHNRYHCRFCKDVVPAKFESHGHIIGVVDLVDVHVAQQSNAGTNVCFDTTTPTGDICSPWAQAYDEFPAYRGHHLVLANPRPLIEPIPFKGALGLRHLDDDTTARILAQIGDPT